MLPEAIGSWIFKGFLVSLKFEIITFYKKQNTTSWQHEVNGQWAAFVTIHPPRFKNTKLKFHICCITL